MSEPRELASWLGHYENLIDFSLKFMDRQLIIDLVRKIAPPLDPALVCAIIEQESGFDTWAIRYEPSFLVKYVPKNLPVTEYQGRAFSWGAMQCMGQVAREVGFKGPLAQLCSPETGISVGCQVFHQKMLAARGDVRQALLYWNGGGNPRYADEVLARIGKFA